MVRSSLVAFRSMSDDLVVLTLGNPNHPKLTEWQEHLDLHEVTLAPRRIGDRVVWIAPWAGADVPEEAAEEAEAVRPDGSGAGEPS